MRYVERIIHDPQSTLDYGFDLSAWLVKGDQIVSGSWSISGLDGALTISSSTTTAKTVTVWLTGGTNGNQYHVTCHFTTVGGRVDDRTLLIVVADR